MKVSLEFAGYSSSALPKLKLRWDVHLSGDDDQLGCAGESLPSVLGELPGSVVLPPPSAHFTLALAPIHRKDERVGVVKR